MSSPTLSTSDQVATATSGTPAVSKTPVVSTSSNNGQHVDDNHNPVQAGNEPRAGRSAEAEKLTPVGSPSAVVQTERSVTHPQTSSAALTSTRPVATYYPPRRPNIFKARAKHLEYEPAPVATNAVGKTNVAAYDSDDSDEFSMKDLEELNATQKHRMEKKTRQFVRMVQETHWGSCVEDVGAVKEIEE